MKNVLNKKAIYSFMALIMTLVFVMMGMNFGDRAVVNAQQTDEIYYGDTEYTATTSGTTEYEYINYSHKSSYTVRVNMYFPAYYNTNSAITNGCANVAGANIIGFYDRYYENLVPNCVTGYMGLRHYAYYGMSIVGDYIQDVIDSLYISMSTNNPNPGTTQTQFKTGLTSYVNSKSLSTTYTTIMTSGSFDETKALAAINAGNPIILYMSGFNISTMGDSGSTVTLVKNIYTANHIFIAYGYRKIDFYDSNDDLITSKIFMYVSTGIADEGIYIVNNNGTLNDAEGIDIS